MAPVIVPVPETSVHVLVNVLVVPVTTKPLAHVYTTVPLTAKAVVDAGVAFVTAGTVQVTATGIKQFNIFFNINFIGTQ